MAQFFGITFANATQRKTNVRGVTDFRVKHIQFSRSSSKFIVVVLVVVVAAKEVIVVVVVRGKTS